MNDLIKYRTRPSDEQIENLRAFTLRGERSDPVAFAGRNEILRDIPAIIQNKRLDPTLKSITQIIQGAPGAGKTSLLNELDRTNRGDHVSVVRLDGEDLSEPLRVAEQFMGSVGVDAADFGIASTRIHRTTGDIKFAQHQEGWESRQTSPLDRIAQGASVWQTLKPILDVDENHIFLLLVDEAQRVDKSPGKQVNEIVTSLHTGGDATAALRILPIYAGLSDTADRLIDVGLSRQAMKPRQLGVLSLEEARLAAEGFMSDQGMGLDKAITNTDRSELARTFAVASEGWPRHLHHYLTGIAQELVTDCGNPTPTGSINQNDALEHGHQARFDYYIDRLQGAHIGEVGNALEALTNEVDSVDTIKQDDIEQYVLDHYPNRAVDVREQIEHAVHAGVLEPRFDIGYKHYGYPIPSFSTFMSCRGEREATLKNMRTAFQSRLSDVVAESESDNHSGLSKDEESRI